MSGLYNGAQASIRLDQPLALYVHCVSHCINLATEAAVAESAMIRNALGAVNELGVLSLQSGKFQNILQTASSSLYDKAVRLRPLCPTRWTVRVKAINHVLQQYESILQALEEMASSHGDSASRAAGLLEQFRQGNTLLALIMAADVVGVMEILNASLQSKKKTMSGMKTAIDHVLQSLASCRESSHFTSLFEQAEKRISEYDLVEIRLPRQRRPPRRYSGPAESFQAQCATDYFRAEYYKMTDMASTKLGDVVHQEGAKTYGELEVCLLSGEVNESCSPYLELDTELLHIQLQMFRQQFTYSSVDEAADVIRNAVPEVRQL